MRAAALLVIAVGLTGCSGMQFDPASIDVDRLPINANGDFFLGREIEW